MASIRFRRGVAIVATLVLFVVVMACVAYNAEDRLMDGDAASTGEDGVEADDGGEDEGSERSTDGDALDETVQRLLEGLGEGEGQWTMRCSNDEIHQAAASVLKRYRDEGDCVLCGAGYADLFGEVWSCVVQGPGWVDLCVISQTQDGTGSEVRSLRMEASEGGRDDGSS